MGKEVRLEIVQLKVGLVHEKDQQTGYLFCKKRIDFANG